jgi:tetratricopeptide (TPR) repeat protein
MSESSGDASEAARDALSQALDRLREAPDDPEANAKAGWELAVAERYPEALPLLEKALEAHPRHPHSWYALGIAHSRLRHWEKAREALEKAVALGYYPARSRGELGMAVKELGQHHAAIIELEAALSAAEDASLRSCIYAGLGQCYHSLKDRQETLRCYRAAVEADPANATAQQGLGASLVDLDEYEAALPHLRTAAHLAPRNGHTAYALGSVLSRAGELEEAQQALERALALGYKGTALAELAWVYQRQGKATAAADLAKRALRQGVPRTWRSTLAGIVNSGQKPRR